MNLEPWTSMFILILPQILISKNHSDRLFFVAHHIIYIYTPPHKSRSKSKCQATAEPLSTWIESPPHPFSVVPSSSPWPSQPGDMRTRRMWSLARAKHLARVPENGGTQNGWSWKIPSKNGGWGYPCFRKPLNGIDGNWWLWMVLSGKFYSVFFLLRVTAWCGKQPWSPCPMWMFVELTMLCNWDDDDDGDDDPHGWWDGIKFPIDHQLCWLNFPCIRVTSSTDPPPPSCLIQPAEKITTIINPTYFIKSFSSYQNHILSSNHQSYFIINPQQSYQNMWSSPYFIKSFNPLTLW